MIQELFGQTLRSFNLPFRQYPVIDLLDACSGVIPQAGMDTLADYLDAGQVSQAK